MPSSVVHHFEYDAAQRYLTIEFVTGRRYRYREVPPDEAIGMTAAFSKGTYFNRHIRNHYAFDRLR